MQSVIYYQVHPFKTSVLYSMFFFLVAQCLSYISMVGLNIITFSLKWVMLKPVMLTVPLYWLQSDRATQQLFSAIPQILWFRKFILWNCFRYYLLLLCCGLNDCNRNLARQKKTNNENSRRSGIHRIHWDGLSISSQFHAKLQLNKNI